MLAANLKARHAISYADGFAAATALLQDAPLVTGDPEMKAMAAAEDAPTGVDWPLDRPGKGIPACSKPAQSPIGVLRLPVRKTGELPLKNDRPKMSSLSADG